MRKTIIWPALLAMTGMASAATITVGVVGTTGGVNNWPGGEPPTSAIDGVGQKYLNFGKENTGVLVTPASTAIPTTITLWSANDAWERDPDAYQLFGTNSDVSGGGPFNSSLFTLISEGPILLPGSRNGGGNSILLAENSVSDTFANSEAFSSYMILFPVLFDSATANSMQVAEIQLTDGNSYLFTPNDTIVGVQSDGVPEPSAALLGLLGLLPLLRRRR